MHAVKIQGAFAQKAGVAFDLMTEHGCSLESGDRSDAVLLSQKPVQVEFQDSLRDAWFIQVSFLPSHSG